MRLRLFSILSALSLLMFAVVCVLWARSYWVGEEWALRLRQDDERAAEHRIAIRSAAGSIGVRLTSVEVDVAALKRFNRQQLDDYNSRKEEFPSGPPDPIKVTTIANGPKGYAYDGSDPRRHSSPLTPKVSNTSHLRRLNRSYLCPVFRPVSFIMVVGSSRHQGTGALSANLS